MLKTKLSTPRWKECAGFYQQLIGMEIVEQWDQQSDKGIILAFPGDPQQAFIELYHCDQEHDFSGVGLQFKVPDVEVFLARLPDDIPHDGPHPRPWGARYVFLKDPAGASVVIFDGPTF